MDKNWILPVVLCLASIVYIGRSQEDCKVEILNVVSPLYLPYNTATWLNCSYTCPSAVWKTRLSKENTTSGTNWVAIKVTVDDWVESTARCIYAFENDTTEKVITVMAYALAEQVTIDMQRELEEGKQYNVTCTAYNVAPVSHLNISLTRGGEVINSKKYVNDSSTLDINKLPPVIATFEITASREDNLQEFACQATLELGTIPNTTVQSSSATVRTFALPEDPHIKVNKWIENGSSTIALCLVSKAFPLKNVTLQMMIDETSLDGNTSITCMPDDIISGFTTLQNSSYDLGQHSITCISEVKGLSRKSIVYVNIYEAPKVDVILSSKTVDLGNTVTADCIIANSNPKIYCVAISVDGHQGPEKCNSNLSYNITASQRQPTISVTCSVFIEQNNNISDTSTETITVHYPPQFSDELCPTRNTLVEGWNKTFPCRSNGNPWPTVRCGSLTVGDDTIHVTRNMSDSYECIASNSKGTARRNVNLTVEYAPSAAKILLSHDQKISNGESFNLTCESEASPAPKYRWEMPSENHVVFSLDKSTITINMASSAHSGIYTCEAMNDHGTSTDQREVIIETVIIALWIWIVVGVGALILIILAVLVFISLKSKGKKGFYDLLSRSNKRGKKERQTNGNTKQDTPLQNF